MRQNSWTSMIGSDEGPPPSGLAAHVAARSNRFLFNFSHLLRGRKKMHIARTEHLCKPTSEVVTNRACQTEHSLCLS